MSGALRKRTCCCKRRNGSEPPPECDPSTYPSSVLMVCQFDNNCTDGAVFDGGGIHAIAGYHDGSGSYTGSKIHTMSVSAHPFLPPGEIRRIPGRIDASARFGFAGCGSGEFTFVRDAGNFNWPYQIPPEGDRISFRAYTGHCGDCGPNRLGKLLEWSASLPWQILQPYPVWYGSECCGDYIQPPSVACICRNPFFCNEWDVCDKCVAFNLSSASMSVS